MRLLLKNTTFFQRERNHPSCRIHIDDHNAAATLAAALQAYLSDPKFTGNFPVIACIGTDRSTGDALGPLTGSFLYERLAGTPIAIYGTLDQPVHATNLEAVAAEIMSRHKGRPVLAIDACLGKSENIGYITLKNGPLAPGTGVNKKLPQIGDFHIVGVVNVGGFMEYFVLQNTRLSLVMRMAQIIALAVTECLQTIILPGSTPAWTAGS